MSDENEFDGNEGEGVASLRKQYNALKKQNDEMLASLANYQKQERQSTLAAALKAKGLPEKAASLYTGDDVSDDAVGKWLESYADVFGAAPQQQTSTTVIDPNAEAAQRTSAAAYENAEPGFDQLGQVFGDPSEAEKLMRSLPYEELEKRGWVPAAGTLHNPGR